MSNPYRKVSPGERLQIPAQAWNRLMDLAGRPGRADGGADLAPGRMLVRNDSGALVPRFGVLELTYPLIMPGIDEGEFCRQLGFSGVEPSGEAGTVVAVLQQAAEPGAIVPAAVHEATVCRLNVVGEGDAYADASGGETRVLVTQSGRDAAWRVVWRESGSGSGSGGSGLYGVVVPAPAGQSGGATPGSLTVSDSRQAPDPHADSVSQVNALTADNDYGLEVLHDGGAGSWVNGGLASGGALLRPIPAGETQRGVVDTESQKWAGPKQLRDGAVLGGIDADRTALLASDVYRLYADGSLWIGRSPTGNRSPGDTDTASGVRFGTGAWVGDPRCWEPGPATGGVGAGLPPVRYDADVGSGAGASQFDVSPCVYLTSGPSALGTGHDTVLWLEGGAYQRRPRYGLVPRSMPHGAGYPQVGTYASYSLRGADGKVYVLSFAGGLHVSPEMGSGGGPPSGSGSGIGLGNTPCCPDAAVPSGLVLSSGGLLLGLTQGPGGAWYWTGSAAGDTYILACELVGDARVWTLTGPGGLYLTAEAGGSCDPFSQTFVIGGTTYTVTQ